MVNGKTLIISVLAVILLGVGIASLSLSGQPFDEPVAVSFEECVARGFTLHPETPQRCTTPEGISFIEGSAEEEGATPPDSSATSSLPIEEPETFPEPQAACVVGGCSSQMCVEEGDPGMSTCEYRAEYACYREAVCERQTSGMCGWTQSSELTACLENPPEL